MAELACRMCGRPVADPRWLDFLVDDKPIYAQVQGPYCGSCALKLDLDWRRREGSQATAWYRTPARGGVFA